MKMAGEVGHEERGRTGDEVMKELGHKCSNAHKAT